MFPKIAKVVVGLPVDGPFDYSVGEDVRSRLAIGDRVRVLFNRRSLVGFVVGSSQKSAFKRLNPILSVLDEAPVLDERALQLARAVSAHHGCSLGEAIETYLPVELRDGKVSVPGPMPGLLGPDLSVRDGLKIFVHDHTREKRWPLIIQHIQGILTEGQGVIVLVPEIGFIGETVQVLSRAFGRSVAVLDRSLTPKQQLAQWVQIRQGDFPVVVGTRSVVFAPLPRLGLIVIDEEEHVAYKQEQVPHYHVYDVAAMRARIEGCGLMLVSSAPSAETWARARRKPWQFLELKEDRAVKIQLVDMTNYNPGKTSILSFPLQNAIRKTLEQKGKIILFMNRRGFSSRTKCQHCGFTLQCERCNVNLTYLYSKKTMVCRYCHFQRDLPKMCPGCQKDYLRSTGTGIEKLESEAARYYPAARICHYDSESQGFPEEADIVITTQALFRRQGPSRASLVAVLDFDAQMHHFDFRCAQKAFSRIIHLKQLAGEMFLIQTRMKDNYCLKAVCDGDFGAFYREELKLRRELALPPSRTMVAVRLRGRDEGEVFEQSQALYARLTAADPKGIMISDLHPDVTPKLRDKYRFTILLKGKTVKSILALVKHALQGFRKKNVIVTVDVNP